MTATNSGKQPGGHRHLRDVSIIGIGQTAVGEHWERSLRDLAVDAIEAALQDAKAESVEALYVGNMLSGELVAQTHLGALIADWASLGPIEAMTLEAAGASGAAAIRVGYMSVASGVQDLAVVCGVEKTTDTDAKTVNASWSSALDGAYETSQCLSVTAMAALLMRRYMHEFGIQREDFGPFAVNAHQNAVNNPNAMFRRPISAKAFAKARMVVDPVSMLDAAPMCDGAAAVVLCSSGRASLQASGCASRHLPSRPTAWRSTAGLIRCYCARLRYQHKRRTSKQGSSRTTLTCSSCTTHSPSWLRYLWKRAALQSEERACDWRRMETSPSEDAFPSVLWEA